MVEKVVVAMSGGVDSSIAAYLLLKEGYDVIGITMDVIQSSCRMSRSDTCCSLSAFEDARQVAERIGIPHYLIDIKKEFEQDVITPFVEGYLSGKTPNPCIICNKVIKFGLLLNRAEGFGATSIATGHYSIREKSNGRYLLKKGIDPRKDQSYFLYSLSQEQLRVIHFPNGGYFKDAVRKTADSIGLPVAKKVESQEICFVPENNYRAFLLERLKEILPGPILNKEGKEIGRHEGIPFYTIGQRRGLSYASGRPQYVIKLDAAKNAVTIGDEQDLYSQELIAEDVNWIAIEGLSSPLSVLARIRYRHQESPATIFPQEDQTVKVIFKEPQRAITPGQSVVFYQGDIVVGGGIIKPETG